MKSVYLLTINSNESNTQYKFEMEKYMDKEAMTLDLQPPPPVKKKPYLCIVVCPGLYFFKHMKLHIEKKWKNNDKSSLCHTTM